MTREERNIEILKNELACVHNVDCERSECRNCNLVMPEHDITEALQMAIKALEQEPCDDTVSREAVLGCLYTTLESYYIRRKINDLPSVQPKPQLKTGRWIIIDDCEQFIAKCSECGRIEDSRMISKYPYCHCGARMIESEE